MQVRGGFSGFGGGPEPEWCCNVMVEATTCFRLDPTSILDVYKVFLHLDMVWMGVWVHSYTARPVQVGGGFWGFGGRSEPEWCCNVIVEATTCFRLDPTSILDVYKVFWNLDMVWMGIWVHPYTVRPVQVRRGFWGFGADLSPIDVVMSLLRLQQALDWILHPYWM